MIQCDESWLVWDWKLAWCLVKVVSVSGVNMEDDEAKIMVDVYRARTYKGKWVLWKYANNSARMEVTVESIVVSCVGLKLTKGMVLSAGSLRRVEAAPGSAVPLVETSSDSCDED